MIFVEIWTVCIIHFYAILELCTVYQLRLHVLLWIRLSRQYHHTFALLLQKQMYGSHSYLLPIFDLLLHQSCFETCFKCLFWNWSCIFQLCKLCALGLCDQHCRKCSRFIASNWSFNCLIISLFAVASTCNLASSVLIAASFFGVVSLTRRFHTGSLFFIQCFIFVTRKRLAFRATITNHGASNCESNTVRSIKTLR